MKLINRLREGKIKVKKLVSIQNGQAVTDSLTVAEVFGKRHDSVMRDIRNQKVKLVEAGMDKFIFHNFVEREYQSQQGNFYKKYELTEDAFALVAMSYVTPEAMKFKVKFLQEFKRIKAELQGKPKILTEREQLMASMKLSIEAAEEIPVIKKEVTDLKRVFSEELTLNHGQQQSLHHEIKKRVESLIGDYQECGFTKQRMYSEIHKNLRRAFSTPKYIFVKRKDYQEAIAWVKAWRPLL